MTIVRTEVRPWQVAFWVTAVLGLSLCSVSPAQGQSHEQQASVAATGQFDEAAAALLEKVSAYSASLNEFAFSATVNAHTASGKHDTETTDYHFAFRRPNLFHMSMKLPDESLVVKADGHKLMLALGSAKESQIREQPADLGTLVGWLTQQPAFRRSFSSKLTTGWMEHVRHAKRTEEVVNGQLCDRLDMTFDWTDVTIWFRQGTSPTPVKLISDRSRTINHPKGILTTEIIWTGWNMDPTTDPDLFVVSPPDGFKEVSTFADTHPAAQGNRTSGPSLTGLPMPPFALELLEKGSASLQEHLGKHILLLEFWTTSCHPCRISLRDMELQLPHLSECNAVVYAVNLMDTRELVADFVRKRDVRIPVALDPKGELGEQLHLEAVPTTVVVGRDGIIRAVHVGYDKGLMRQIRGEIDALAQGKDLPDAREDYSASTQLRYRLGLDSQAYCAVFVGY